MSGLYRPLSLEMKNIERKQLFVVFYQGYLTCLSASLISGGKSRADTTQQEAGGSQSEKEMGRGGKLPSEGGGRGGGGGGVIRGVKWRKEGVGGGGCIGYNLSHMAYLKKTASRSHNHSFIALWLFSCYKAYCKARFFSYIFRSNCKKKNKKKQ